MNRRSNLVHYKHTITKSSNFKSVGLTPNLLWVRHW